jgi:type I pantothenate kinase
VVNGPLPTERRHDPALYRSFDRQEWARLRASTPLEVTEEELTNLISFNDALSLDEVREIYLPMTRLLNLYVGALQDLHSNTDAFFGRRSRKVPFVIGVAGSVAVGKSTTARLLQTLLARWTNHPRVDLVTTDGFLYPTAELDRRGIMGRKGFPESYDVRRMVRFLADVKGGCPVVNAPVYSHLAYDIVEGEYQVVRQPDILIFEGLNVLQPPSERELEANRPVVSDFFDFSIYVDADEADNERWYLERFLAFRETVFADERSYFHRYSKLDASQAEETARGIWASINLPNLRENIAPTRERARLIVHKGSDHHVERLELRKL